MSGDVTGDGVVSMADVVRVARAAAKYITLTGAEHLRADVDGNGVITMADVVIVARLTME